MSKKVEITTVDTKLTYDAHQNIPGRSTRTVLFIDPVARRATYHNRTYEEEIRKYLEDGLGQDLLQQICDGYDEDGTLSQGGHMALHELYDDLNESKRP